MTTVVLRVEAFEAKKREGKVIVFEGNQVFKSKAAAQTYIDTFGLGKMHRVYGIKLDWETETRPSASDPSAVWKVSTREAEAVRIA